MSSSIQKIKEAYEVWVIEDLKHQEGNGAAGSRARKALTELGKLAKLRRAEIQAEKNARKEAKTK